MTIVSAYTPNLDDKIHALKESLERYADNFVLIRHEPEQIETFSKDWPKNRKFYCTAQGGEFLDLMDNPPELICLIDADTIMQRRITAEELEEVTPDPGQFTVCLPCYPARKLLDSIKTLTSEEIKCNPKYIEFCGAMIIGYRQDWKELASHYKKLFPVMREKVPHHALTQWLISWIIQKHFMYKIAPENFANAMWYHGTRAKGNPLYIYDELVIFNHTKWIS